MTILNCPGSLIDETLAHLREGGSQNCETVVLWLGTERDGVAAVHEVYRPEQEVEVDRFRLPAHSVRAMMGRIRETRLHIVAQIHSHPGRAFHSKADDAWAIVRRVGAISIVVPFFAQGADRSNFGDRSATYQLNNANRWAEVRFSEVVEIT